MRRGEDKCGQAGKIEVYKRAEGCGRWDAASGNSVARSQNKLKEEESTRTRTNRYRRSEWAVEFDVGGWKKAPEDVRRMRLARLLRTAAQEGRQHACRRGLAEPRRTGRGWGEGCFSRGVAQELSGTTGCRGWPRPLEQGPQGRVREARPGRNDLGCGSRALVAPLLSGCAGSL